MIETSLKSPVSLGLRWFGITDVGRIRRNNEDTFLCLQFDAQEVRYLGRLGESSTDNGDCLFAVSDGMGGAKAGEFASRIATDKITRLLPRSFRRSAIGMELGFEDVLSELYQQIHKSLTYLGATDPDCIGMGATLSLCWFVPGWALFGHIGDSRIYYLPGGGGQLRQVSQDDTHVGWLQRNGKLTEWQARQHKGKNALQKALGAGHQFVDPQVGAVGCEPGDTFLLCTDGLIDGLFDSQLEEILRSPRTPGHNPAGALVKRAVKNSGRDNTTALVIDIV